MVNKVALSKIENLNSREKILLLITGVSAVMLLGFSFVIEPLLKKQEVSHKLLESALSEQALLVKQLKKINKTATTISKVSESKTKNGTEKYAQTSTLLEKLLLQTPGLELVSLESVSSEPTESQSIMLLEKYQLHVMGDYPAMLKYISDLDKLPFSMRFDDFKYRIKDFPIADIYITISRYNTATQNASSEEVK